MNYMKNTRKKLEEIIKKSKGSSKVYVVRDGKRLKVIKLTKSDRDLLKSIDTSLKAIQKGEVKELIIEQLKKQK